MSPHYTLPAAVSQTVVPPLKNGDRVDDDALKIAADALREADIEAAEPVAEPRDSADRRQLNRLSIDELRALAAELKMPNCGQIVEQADLIAAIRARL